MGGGSGDVGGGSSSKEGAVGVATVQAPIARNARRIAQARARFMRRSGSGVNACQRRVGRAHESFSNLPHFSHEYPGAKRLFTDRL